MKGVILAAGLGTRLYPITENKPKHMIPIGGKPLILHLLAALKSNGINELILVVRHGENFTRNLLEDGGKFGLKIEYSTQEVPTGTASAVESAEELIGEEEFLVVYGDLLLKEELIHRLLKSFEEHGEMVLAAVPVKDVSQYGLINSRGEKLMKVEEKPEGIGGEEGNLANAGLYVFKKKEIFKAIKRT
ncbi:TPA: nucleotidyltransferase family protein, partial [Candidatus Bathyarchaeota archaeon]|nr:nucleotidyltransferase family protein [Candidatus Bathyarchaeota archaeon]